MLPSNSNSTLLKLGLLSTAGLATAYAAYSYLQPELICDIDACQGHVRKLIRKEQMFAIIEDLKIQLTPYYIHYYNILKNQEEEAEQTHGSREKGLKSAVLHEFREKVQDKLDEKRSNIQDQVFKEHLVTSQRFVYSAMFYRNGTTDHLEEYGPDGKIQTELYVDAHICEQLDMINEQEDKLFAKGENGLYVGLTGKPDFKLYVPEELTKDVYLVMIKKLFAQIRFEVYVKIRKEMRENNLREMTKQSLKAILKKLDLWEIRNQVFDLFKLGELNEPTHRTLMKAHVNFLSGDTRENNVKFEQEMRDIRQIHQRYMTAILSADVFPKLERNEPLKTRDEDEIPDKFGKNWFQFTQGNQGSQYVNKSVFIDDHEDSDDECTQRKKDFQNMNNDIWKHTDKNEN